MLRALVELVRVWTRPRTLGERGEAAAGRYLRRSGYVIVARGSRTRTGEIDIVAVEGRTIVFVEVKTRAGHAAGHPVDAVDADKQAQLTRLALAFLRRHGLLEHRARFDVVAVTWPANQRQPVIEHFKNAFEPVGEGQLFS